MTMGQFAHFRAGSLDEWASARSMMYRSTIIPALPALLVLCAARFSPGAISQWDFNGDLASATGGSNLVAGAAAPAASPGGSLTTATIGGQTASVVSLSRGTFLRMNHGFTPNGGGSLVNNYTLIMDVMFPSRPTGWAVLWQT